MRIYHFVFIENARKYVFCRGITKLSFAVVSQSESVAAKAYEFAQAHGYRYVESSSIDDVYSEADFLLRYTSDGLFLSDCRQGKPVDITVDFVKGAHAHRRLYGGGKGQAIAKAVGLSKGIKPHLFDATAGLGGDAFVLATLGCAVDMNERNPVIYQLLSDGLARARLYAEDNDPGLLEILDRMKLTQSDSLDSLSPTDEYDVIYLDPMFPESSKTAKVKKGMQAFHYLIGRDDDAGKLLELALNAAKYRVAVKRPRIAPFLADRKPNLQFEGKSSRFDIYTIKKMA